MPLPHRDMPLAICLIPVLGLLTLVGPLAHAFAQEGPSAQQSKDAELHQRFHAEIAPLLAEHCLECHSATSLEGGLNLTERDGALSGGDSGPAIVPGDTNASLLLDRVLSGEMPPDRPSLSEEEIQVLRQWIDQGAVWSPEAIDPLAYSSDHRAGYDWWALAPIQRPTPPTVTDDEQWVINDIDRFVLARLQDQGLAPAPPADRRTLIRRLYFDLIGLPPEPEAVEAFVNDPSPTAYASLVDRLLNSPQYGERWARHWLDVVRFGETQGYERNRIRENAWRYRDWVIKAFNQDLPYDEFVRMQIAGDCLYPGDYDALMATGYHVCGTWDQVGHMEGSATMQMAARWDHMEDLVGTLGQTFLGLTIQCSRCHDHKFDPISQRDYYQIAALLGGVHQEERERSDLVATHDAAREAVRFAGSAHVPVFRQPPVFHVLARGDFRKPTDPVSPRGVESLAAAGLSADLGLAPDAPEADRRRALAHWLTDPCNPLTPRVFVNRLWHYHLGRGIVDTPSDFGFSGGRPSHPELLDWLSSRFVDSGWRIKAMHRQIVTSATYRQQSNVSNERAEQIDAENRLLWRANVRRLEGEAIRDAALLVAGALNRQIGGPSFRDVRVQENNNHEFTDPTNEFHEGVNRRTIYRLWARSGSHPLLEALDCPDPSVTAPVRSQTITPVQSLSMLHNATMEQCGQHLARRLQQEAGDSPADQIDRAYWIVYSRPVTERERELGIAFLEKYSLADYCLVLINANEFLYVN